MKHHCDRGFLYLRVRALIFLSGSLSILSLLFYFFGFYRFQTSAIALLTAEFVSLLALWLWARRSDDRACHLLTSGLWAGGLATLAYDIARIPVAHAGIPVFKAISYFGTVLLGVESPTPLSEALGWAYHLSNGVSFGLMYAALVTKPRLLSAVLWGLTLEATMLLTPYAEVFGYRRDATFLAITIGAHVVYGLMLWMALRLWDPLPFRLSPRQVTFGFLCVPLALYLVACDFYVRFARRLPQSPPSYIGSHLYTTWDVPEPDRIVAMWMTRRFVEPEAEFHFIAPFETIKYGRPFDVPEAQIRREGQRSATEALMAQRGLAADAKRAALARMTHLTEISSWMLAADPEAGELAEKVRAASDQACGKTLNRACAEKIFDFLDNWYEER